jgi:hypothetical protein
MGVLPMVSRMLVVHPDDAMQARIAGAGTHQAHNADRRRIGNRNGRRT